MGVPCYSAALWEIEPASIGTCTYYLEILIESSECIFSCMDTKKLQYVSIHPHLLPTSFGVNHGENIPCA